MNKFLFKFLRVYLFFDQLNPNYYCLHACSTLIKLFSTRRLLNKTQSFLIRHRIHMRMWNDTFQSWFCEDWRPGEKAKWWTLVKLLMKKKKNYMYQLVNATDSSRLIGPISQKLKIKSWLSGRWRDLVTFFFLIRIHRLL